jgi:hypothetical protein
MLRAAVLMFGSLALAVGLYLCAMGAALRGGVQCVIGGSLFLLGTLFERWRYHNKNASVDGDWQPTGERFVDPATGKNVEVLYDPQSGERRYRTVGERYTRPD